MKYALLLFIFLFPVAASAAELTVTAPYDAVHKGDEFTVSITLDPKGNSVNALEGGILVSSNLKVLEARLNDSIIPLWVERPQQSGGGLVRFSGIIPGGYRGTVSTEWQGYKAGNAFTLLLSAEKEGEASISFASTTSVYANDGVGTSVPLNALGIHFPVLQEGTSHSAPSISIDTVPPEVFDILVADGADFGQSGKVLVFNTEDKQSGVLYYEIAKSDVDTSDLAALSWQKTESPYSLSTEDLRRYIYVRAIDYYGNARVARVPPVGTPLSQPHSSSMLLVGLLIIGLILSYVVYRRRAPRSP